MVKLICLSGINKGETFELKEGENILGRSEQSDICVFDKKASRRHCSIIISGDKMILKDLNSTNGVRINNVFISGEHPLKIGDHIRIGQTVFLFTDEKKKFDDIPESTTSKLIKRREKYAKLLNKASFKLTQTTSLRRVKMEKNGRKTGFLSFIELKKEEKNTPNTSS